MAVGTGAGALNATKPVTVNDMMEAIQLPGLKPQNGFRVNLAGDADARTGEGETSDNSICQIGRAGYTEVLDDIIVDVTHAGSGAITLDVGLKLDNAAVSATRFLSQVTVPSVAGTYSVLRGSFDWAATGNDLSERTFTPGNGGTITYDLSDSANTSGIVRVYARTHYTDVNFGSGL